MKYIVVRGPGGELPVLFARSFYHRHVANQFGGPANVVSAGFVRMTKSGIECHGASSSLGMESRPVEDSILVTRHFAD